MKKEGKKTDGVQKQYCESVGRMTGCKVVVSSHYADVKKDYPLNFEAFYPGEETKIDLAKSLIREAQKQGIKFEHVVFDRWYCNKSIWEECEKLGFKWISTPKSNRIVYYQGQKYSLEGLVTALREKSDQDIIDVQIKVKDYFQKLRLVIHPKRVLLTNDFKATAEHIFEQYKKRWRIEDFYHDAKDNLCFDHFQVRNGLSILRHLILVSLAYTFTIWSRAKGVWSKIADFAVKTTGDVAKVIRGIVQYKNQQVKDNVFLRYLKLKTAV